MTLLEILRADDCAQLDELLRQGDNVDRRLTVDSSSSLSHLGLNTLTVIPRHLIVG
jgi:hypothetical protein